MKSLRQAQDLKVALQPKVALVHDDLVQWGGAERVLVALTELFPQAPIYTSVYDNHHKLLNENFKSKKIVTSFIQSIPGWKSLYKSLLPFYPLAFEQFDFSQYDLVISHSTRFAKCIITKPQTKHVCYCPTPPRFLWNFSGEKVGGLLSPYISFLRVYDHLVSRRVDFWLANSINVQQRIRKIYQAEARVVYPFVDLDRFANVQPFDGDYLLVITRLNKYKRVDLVVEAANRLKLPLKVVGLGPEYRNLTLMAGPTVELLGGVDEDLLTSLLSGCKVLVVAGEEDFGMVALEAQALGKPVVAFGKGGSLETVIQGQTGYLFKEQTVESLTEALETLDKRGYNYKRCFENAANFSKTNFLKRFQTVLNTI